VADPFTHIHNNHNVALLPGSQLQFVLELGTKTTTIIHSQNHTNRHLQNNKVSTI